MKPTLTQAQPTPTVEHEFVYVLEDRSTANNLIYGYQLDGATGQLASLGIPVDTGYAGDDNANGAVQRLAFHPGTRRLFAINDGSSNILSSYEVNTFTGALTSVFTQTLGAGAWTCVAVHPSGSPVIVGGGISVGGVTVGRIHSFVINTSGVYSETASLADAVIPQSCRFSQDGQYLYAGGYNATSIAGFQVNATNGSLTPLAGSPFDSGVSYPSAYATDDQGRLFVADSLHTNAPLRVFSTSAGVPTAVVSSTVASGLDYIYDGLWHPAGYYIAATYTGLGVFRVSGNGATTTLTKLTGPPYPSMTSGPLALSRTGTLLLATNILGGDINTLLVNPTTGDLNWVALTHVGALPTVLSGMVYAAAPLPPATTSGYVYALRDYAAGNQIFGYRVDLRAGGFTLLNGFPVATEGTGRGSYRDERLSFDPVQGRLYALNDGSHTLSAFAVDLTSGALTPMAGSPFALANTSWSCVKTHPSGSPVIVGGGNTLFSFQSSSGTLTPVSGSPFHVGGTNVRNCAFSSDGGYFYVAGPDIGAYKVDSTTGALTALPGSPFFSGAGDSLGLAVDSANRLFMTESQLITETQVISGTTQTVTTTKSLNYVYTLQNGKPVAVSGNPFAWKLGTDPVATLLHPAGYYMVANSLGIADAYHGSSLSVFRPSGSGITTSLDLISSVPASEPPQSFPLGAVGLATLTVDHAGTMLFAANEGTGSLQSFSFDPATGVPQGLNTLPMGALGGTWISISGLVYAAALPDLTLSMSSSSVFAPNQDVAYTLQVANRSIISATTPITVVDDLPVGLSFLVANGVGWSCTALQGQVTCTHPASIPGGGTLSDLVLTTHLATDLASPPVNLARVLPISELRTDNNEASFTPARAEQSIQFSPLPDRRIDDAPFTITVTANSGLPVQLTSSTTGICTVSGSTVILKSTGICAIIAAQPGNWAYASAFEVSQSFLVSPIPRAYMYLPLIWR